MSAVIVSLPAEIDITNAEQVYDRIFAAVTSGAAVIVADLTATMFCDSAGVQRIVMIHRHAADRGIQVRLAVAPGGPVRRVLELTGLHQQLPVYASVTEAASTPARPVAEPPMPS